eukprot:2998058-Pyramimonas_sp.AAC.1
MAVVGRSVDLNQDVLREERNFRDQPSQQPVLGNLIESGICLGPTLLLMGFLARHEEVVPHCLQGRENLFRRGAEGLNDFIQAVLLRAVHEVPGNS